MKAATPVVEDLLEVVTLVAKSYGVIAQLSIDKDIDIMRRVTSPPTIGDVTGIFALVTYYWPVFD